ncbi:T9SS type A sorting domain-containing protein [candidate division KSB1 bacterium]|nr:T9SS type A sorting domain-containing protein [candidate division KSB1 bacterium]
MKKLTLIITGLILVFGNLFAQIGPNPDHMPVEKKSFFSETEQVLNDTVHYTIPDTSAYKNSKITIPVYADDVTDKNIFSVGLAITFDPNILTAENVSTNGTIAEFWGNPTFNIFPGQVTMGMAGTTALSGSGPLVYFDFTVIGDPGNSTVIHFKNALTNEGEPYTMTADGHFAVREVIENVNVTIPDAVVKHLSQITIPINVDDVSEKDIMSVGIILHYDPAVLESPQVSAQGTIAESWGEPTYSSAVPGQLSIASAGSLALNGSGVLFQINFNVSGRKGDSTAIHLEKTIFNEGNPLATTFDGRLIVINSSPSPFNLLLPGDGAVVDTLNPALSWHSSSDIDNDPINYTLFIDTNNSFNMPTTFVTSDTFFNITGDLEKALTYYWQVTAVDSDGDSTECNQHFAFTTSDDATAVGNKSFITIPEKFAISQNYPNPFNPETTIHYELPLSCHVMIKVYNTLGREIRTLVNEKVNVGYHNIIWDGRDFSGQKASSGIYFYQIKAESFIEGRKMLLLQ